MSITSQKYYSVTFSELNEKSKAKENNKENKKIEISNNKSADSNDLYEKVRVQGEVVRDLKAKKASKVK
jgi:hypothetical protein